MSSRSSIPDPNRIPSLIIKYLANKLTHDESSELLEWINKSENNKELFLKILDKIKNQEVLDNINVKKEWKEFGKKHSLPDSNITDFNVTDSNVKKKSRLHFLLAAAVVGMCFISILLFYQQGGNHKSTSHNFFEPNTEGTILTLSDGSQVNIDTTTTPINQKHAIIRKVGEDLSYISLPGGTNDAEFNSLSTHFGKQSKILLPDGSKVWLNASSSIHFPTSFNSKIRKIELKGEGYFEISKQTDSSLSGGKVPFIVEVAGIQINVLGTHFNVKAYDDNNIKASLLEGVIEIRKGYASCLMAPGEQAMITPLGKFAVSKINSTEDPVGWRKDLFVFYEEDIKTVMQEVERWYNVKVVFENPVNDKLTMNVSRKVPLENLLQIIQESCNAHFSIENRTIFIW